MSSDLNESLIAELERDPYAFEFFRAVRLLEALQVKPKVGESLNISGDIVRFGQNPSLSFPPSTIEAFHMAGAESPPRMDVRFFGLFGTQGPMPLHFTEFASRVVGRNFDKKPTNPLVEFLNIFHHRLISLFYRTWAAHQKSADCDRALRTETAVQGEQRESPQDWSSSRFSMYIASFIGGGMEALRGGRIVPDWAHYYFSGHLACKNRHASGLRAILSEFFGMTVDVVQFVGEWFHLPADALCALSERSTTSTLGETIILGDQTFQCDLKVRIQVGHLDYQTFRRFLPDKTGFQKLRSWMLAYLGDALVWDLSLQLKASEVPLLILPSEGSQENISMAGSEPLLGWNTWLASEPFQQDSDPVFFDPLCEEFQRWATTRVQLELGERLASVRIDGESYFHRWNKDVLQPFGIPDPGTTSEFYQVTQSIEVEVPRFLPGELAGFCNNRIERRILLPTGWQSSIEVSP